MSTRTVEIPAAGVRLAGDLVVPEAATGTVVFAHGSGSSRHSPRNRAVADSLNRRGLATLLLDLLTTDEDPVDRFDIALLAERLSDAVEWADKPVGLFGASTGVAAALVTAAQRSDVRAVVSRGGRPDLAGPALGRVRVPTLLLVGGRDPQVLDLNRRAQDALGEWADLHVIPGAGHLFEEPGTLDEVARRAVEWFVRHLPG